MISDRLSDDVTDAELIYIVSRYQNDKSSPEHKQYTQPLRNIVVSCWIWNTGEYHGGLRLAIH